MASKTAPKPVSINVDYELHPKQLEIKRSRARFKVVAAGRRGGKTQLAGLLGLYGDGHTRKGAVLGDKVWWVAPDYPRATIGWNLAKLLTQNIPASLKTISEEQRKISFVTGGWIQIKSGFDPDSLRGEGLDYVILDEAAFMKPEAWTEGLRPALADRQGGALFISTPKGFNYFHELYEKGAKRDRINGGGAWESFHFTSYDNPHVANSEIEETRQDYEEMGQLHVFRQEFLAEFLEGGGKPIFPRQWWDEGRNRYDPTDTRFLSSLIGGWIFVDTANTAKVENARTAFVYGQLTPDYRLVIRDMQIGRWTFDELPSVAVQFGRKHYGHGMKRLRHFWIEDRASGTQLIQVMRVSPPRFIAEVVTPAKAIVQKEVAWGEAAVWARRGYVMLPFPHASNREWYDTAVQEIFNVPGSKFFDVADSFAGLTRHLSPYFSQSFRRKNGAA